MHQSLTILQPKRLRMPVWTISLSRADLDAA